MLLPSSCSCVCPIYWGHMLSWEWRCSWSSADMRCSNYIWVIYNLIAYKGESNIRYFTVCFYVMRTYDMLCDKHRLKYMCCFENKHLWYSNNMLIAVLGMTAGDLDIKRIYPFKRHRYLTNGLVFPKMFPVELWFLRYMCYHHFNGKSISLLCNSATFTVFVNLFRQAVDLLIQYVTPLLISNKSHVKNNYINRNSTWCRY